MQDVISNLIIGIVGSLIASVIFETLRSFTGIYPEPSPPPLQNGPSGDDDGDPRRQNRERIKRMFSNLLFYTLTFFLIYEALSLPLFVKVFFSKETVLLSSAKIIGFMLPDVVVTSEVVQVKLLFFVVPLYTVSLLLVNLLTEFVAIFVNYIWKITPLVRQRIQLVLFVGIAASLAIVSIWLFFPVTLQDAIYNFLGAIAVAALFMGARR